eukprot:TRINITY_DN10535_c0_g1_i1.p1 TRINITY_DN10535_c0_g1~~TRINITY_DN10535_c0_g1_i1.p1  ORF type:complete len:276 (+),score=43.87 TRINITY_DN10535_c0_g1_i1:187-1014(+)
MDDTLRSLPADFARNTPRKGKVAHKAMKDFNFLTKEENFKDLQSGVAFYGFNCAAGGLLGEKEKDMIQRAINLTSFPPDAEDQLPILDMKDPKDLNNHVFMLNKAMYVLPGVDKTAISPEILASVRFQKACQPGTCKVWEDCDRPDTFRLTKTIIRAVYKMTIQFRCSWVPAEFLPSLAPLCDNLRIDQAILMERTKRDITVKDSTAKVRSLLLYHVLAGGGMVVTNFTCVANTSVPSVIARLVDKLGWAGAGEVAETASKTRAYLLHGHGHGHK